MRLRMPFYAAVDEARIDTSAGERGALATMRCMPRRLASNVAFRDKPGDAAHGRPNQAWR